MKIAVLGAPGAEKSKFARGLAKKFDLKVVDNYVSRLQTKTGLALGPWASYHENFMIAGARLADEYHVQSNDTVTVGTIIDTITYAAVRTDVAMHQTEAAVRAMYAMAQGTMQGLAVLYSETWDYHLSFYLPYSDEQRRKKQGTWEAALDEGYPFVIESYEVPYVYRLNGTTADRINIATKAIDAARKANETAETEAPATD